MLAVRSRRYRSSTSASNLQTSKAAEVLQSLLERVAATSQAAAVDGFPDISKLVEQGKLIHQHVAAVQPPCPPQDDFRHLRGFQTLLDVLRSFSGFYNPQKRSLRERQNFFDLLHIILAIISTTFRGHPGNRRYFQHRVEGGGWEALEQVIASIGLGGSDSDLWTNCQLFGKLLSFSLDDQRLDELCRAVAAAEPEYKKPKPIGGEEQETTRDHADEKKNDDSEQVKQTNNQGGRSDQARNGDGKPPQLDLTAIEAKLRNIIGAGTVIQNPEIMRTVVGFWESIPRARGSQANPASMVVLATLSSVAAVSFFNLTALHATGMLSRFLRFLFAEDPILSAAEKDKILPLCRSLMYLGSSELADTQFLLSRQESETSEFCLAMTEKYSGPPFIQFDLSLHGHSSVELATLGRTFPPPSAPGYTFTAWIRIDRFDPNSHTTLFGVFDSSQTCFLLGYLEKDTRNFILQTSVTSGRPSVRFKSVTFKENMWYHIAIVHRKPKTMVASKASLYVNGEFAEQIRSAYPSPPPLSNGSTESFASFTSSNNKTNPVQAFLGTPRDLSTQLGPGRVFSKWSLASAHMLEDVLSDDLLTVHFRLGPRYQGNFQDCLGGFQTYEASAALGLRNEVFHPGKDEQSDILRAIRDKASTIVPEHKVLMSTLPRAVFRTDGGFMELGLFRSLSRTSASNLLHSTSKSGTAVAINGAVPCINDALIRASGVALLTGDPVLSTPYYFDDNLWRLAGFTPLALKLVERSSNADELLRSVEMMLQCVDSSWRNSEAMERDNGYAILSMLLKAKLGHVVPGSDKLSWRLLLTNDARDRLSFQLLSLVLDFVGYNHENPLESFIVNPLAYRILLIDPDTWRKSAPITQELYYKQFVTFAVKSKYHQFNSRRLQRMRTSFLPSSSRVSDPLTSFGSGIIKRLLDALKAETISDEVLPHFIASFESLVKCNYTAEVHRSLALFITYALHSVPSSHSRTPKPGSATPRSVTPVPSLLRKPTLEISSPLGGASKLLTKKQLGVKILEMYTKLLCEKENLADIRRFAKTVTNKVTILTPRGKTGELLLTGPQWLLYLLADDDPEIVVYGCKILARLLVTQPHGYTSKFASKTGGFSIMAHRLKQWWDIPTIWPLLFSILFNYDVAKIDFDRSFEFFSLIELFSESKIVFPEVLPVIAAMLQQGLRDIIKHQDDPGSPAADPRPVTPTGTPEIVQTRPRARSMELGKALESRSKPTLWDSLF